MAEFDDSGERTEEATDTRREEFRKRGEVAQTRELASSLFLAGIGTIVFFLSGYFFFHVEGLFHFIFDVAFTKLDLDTHRFSDVTKFVSAKALAIAFPFILFSIFISISSHVVQIGFLQVEKAFDINWDRINPWTGVQRIFSLRSLVEGLKSIVKLVVIIGVTYLVIKNDIHMVARVADWEFHQSVYYGGRLILKILASLGLIILVLAGLDYLFQRWSLEKRMMMTKKELKDELKNKEIDPLLKSRLRRMQKEVAQRRMMQKVPQADVVITNPTHIAVALQYTPEMPAPKLIAKGADRIAEKIREIAKEHGIPIIENKPLARIIFKTMKLDQFIPRELYVAVAEVLSYVYRLKKKRKGTI
ncbi:MAG: flagellar biosynthesis protein FlhB [Bdellovibrionaceae bacterium]|nr:flagellar biosynthesis protein FlhB [Pseudobdellovibrionaceae bacterium]MDW8190853.1 flagellar biosynthesis protein FlhB [Pseudobdellovibrionaceae bacterium]